MYFFSGKAWDDPTEDSEDNLYNEEKEIEEGGQSNKEAGDSNEESGTNDNKFSGYNSGNKNSGNTHFAMKNLQILE